MHEEGEILEGCNCTNCRLGRIENQLEGIQGALKELQKALKKKK